MCVWTCLVISRISTMHQVVLRWIQSNHVELGLEFGVGFDLYTISDDLLKFLGRVSLANYRWRSFLMTHFKWKNANRSPHFHIFFAKIREISKIKFLHGISYTVYFIPHITGKDSRSDSPLNQLRNNFDNDFPILSKIMSKLFFLVRRSLKWAFEIILWVLRKS